MFLVVLSLGTCRWQKRPSARPINVLNCAARPQSSAIGNSKSRRPKPPKPPALNTMNSAVNGKPACRTVSPGKRYARVLPVGNFVLRAVQGAEGEVVLA